MSPKNGRRIDSAGSGFCSVVTKLRTPQNKKSPDRMSRVTVSSSRQNLLCGHSHIPISRQVSRHKMDNLGKTHLHCMARMF